MNESDDYFPSNFKNEEICRTCLTYEGSFFNISHTFDKITLGKMITDLTNLQIDSADGFTQSICHKCVKETKKAYKFRKKCLKASRTLLKLKTDKEVNDSSNLDDLPLMLICKSEPIEVKVEPNESFNCKNNVKAEYDDEVCYKSEDSSNDGYHDDDIVHYEDIDNEKIVKKKDKGRKTLFDCPLCHGLFCSDNVFKKHIREFHSDRFNDPSFSKPRKPLGFVTKEKKSKNSTKLIYQCAMDDFSGSSMHELKNHLKEHFGDRPVVCTNCDFRTTDIPLLRMHKIQRHTDSKRFACSECDYSCQTPKALRIHSAVHSSEREYKCKLCPREFKRASDLSVHKKIKHEKRKSHVCNICQKAFFHSTRLKAHMVVHTGERPHVCHVCGVTFSQRNNLHTHMSTKHESEKFTEVFKCNVCNYSTKQKIRLSAHMKIHSPEKRFKCTQCPFRTQKSCALKLHLLRHAGDTKYFCDMCDYKCYTVYSLMIHKRIHTGERPHFCSFCSYSGRTQNALQRHMQTHNTDQTFACPYCPYRTNVKEILRRHVKRMCIVKKRGRPPSSLRPISGTSENTMDGDVKEESENYNK